MSVFKGSTLTLGQLADACVYFGGEAAGATQAKPGRQKARPGAAYKTFPVALCLPIPTWSRAIQKLSFALAEQGRGLEGGACDQLRP